MLLSNHPRSAFNNHILSALPRTEYERLYPYLELVRLPQHKILYMAGDVVRYGYFLLGGMASLISITESGRAIEVAMIGNEGMAGIPIVLESNTSPYQVIVQLTGNAMRVKAEEPVVALRLHAAHADHSISRLRQFPPGRSENVPLAVD
jgi:CRP-like cAMP-binding protein